MRVTLLGHAALLVEMGPMTILMDPVLQDPFEDGIVGLTHTKLIARTYRTFL